MKLLLLVLLLVAAAVVGLFAVSLLANTPDAGRVDGKLGPCGDRKNCVSSEADGANIAPLVNEGADEADVRRVADAVRDMGARIEILEPDYLHAVFRSRVFRFRDDFEVRLDPPSGVLHVRSASRSGSDDFGVNRERVDAVRALLQQEL